MSNASGAGFSRIAPDVRLGEGVEIHDFVNLYGCSIGDGTRIGAFVEIQRNAAVGRRCKISSHTFICEGVTIEDECFIGHHVVFVNDRYPTAVTADGTVQGPSEWQVVETRVCRRASIGSGAVTCAALSLTKGPLSEREAWSRTMSSPTASWPAIRQGS
jgi:UDP-2-acetamido-3-amino-2,3-dideoxy-glucuronate N-acetyltransferase